MSARRGQVPGGRGSGKLIDVRGFVARCCSGSLIASFCLPFCGLAGELVLTRSWEAVADGGKVHLKGLMGRRGSE